MDIEVVHVDIRRREGEKREIMRGKNETLHKRYGSLSMTSRVCRQEV